MKLSRHKFNPAFSVPFLMVFLLAGGSNIFAQEEAARLKGGLGAAHLMMVFPQGDFKKEVDKLGFGFSFDLGYGFPQFPVVCGLEGAYAIYGSNTFSVPLGNIEVVTVDVTSENSIFLGHLFLRLQPNTGVFRPYFEGLIGLAVFNTSSSVKNQRTNEEFASSSNSTDAAFSYGGGGGIAFMVYESKKEGSEDLFQVFIDARVRYFYGGKAKYYREDAVYLDEGNNVQFDKSKERSSATDMFTPHLGVMVRF